MLGRLEHGLLKFLEYLCTLNMLHMRTIHGQIKLGKQIPVLSKSGTAQKSHAKAKTRPDFGMHYGTACERGRINYFSGARSKGVATLRAELLKAWLVLTIG